MSGSALILTYHAVEPGPAPLCVDPGLFREHLEILAECDAVSVKISELADLLRGDGLARRHIAITFDDGFASVARDAAPLLAERGLSATVFCVAGHLGRTNDWPTQPTRAPRRTLASEKELVELADAGFEIGSHGMAHAPLETASGEVVRRELIDSKKALEDVVGVPVTSFAHPYGRPPGNAAGDSLLRSSYAAACTGTMGFVNDGSDPLALPRIDIHYIRRPRLLRRALEGSLGRYLGIRRAGARARRVFRPDYARPRGP